MATAKTSTKPAAKKTAPATKAAPAAKKAAVAAPVKGAEPKPTTVAKTAVVAKKAAPVKPKFKPGQQIIGTSAAGMETNGRFVALTDTSRGQWVEMNVGDKKNPIIKRYRPKAVRAA